MTRRQRIVLGVAGGLFLAFVLALAIASLVDDDPDTAIVADATSTTTSSIVADETTTSLDLPTTTAAPATTTTASPTTTTRRQAPAIDGRGAILRPPASPVRRTVRQGGGCSQFADAGWTAECGAMRTDWYWVVETKPAAGGATARRAYMFRQEAGETWVATLETRDDDGSRFAEIRFRGEDIGGDESSEAVFGFRRTGSTRILAVDVVQFPAAVVVHRESPDGSARLSPGQLDLWEAAGTQYDHLTIRYTEGAWRIVATSKVDRAAVPPSHV